jgi:predicted negative regulator of RcsB-dependent stress response
MVALMKASPLAPRLLAILVCCVLASAAGVSAQDAVVLQSGETREGKVVGVSGGNVRLQIDGGATGIPLRDIREIRMAAPPEFDAAATQLATGNASGALAALQKINETFAGLPAPWAERAAAMLGDAKLATGDTAGARAAYESFRTTYPQAPALANLGMARLAVDAGNYDEAAPLLEPILAQSATTAFPPPAEAGALTQAHYLSGRINEAAGDHQAALEHYLKASAVFPFDRASAASAQTRADELRATHAGLIAP